MLRNIFTLALITLFSYTSMNGQTIEKFQTIAHRNASEIVVKSTDDDHYNFGDNRINESSVIIKIEVTSETFPNRILKAMMEQGDFNIRYKVYGGQLILTQIKKSQEVRFDGKTHKIDFNYEILVPMALAYKE